MRIRAVIGVMVFAAVAAWPSAALAVTATPVATVTATPTANATPTASASSARTYDLDFTLPTAGKSGCLVCHGDPNLAKVNVETTSSIYVDVAQLQESAHVEDTPCTGCHLDFAYTAPHKQVEGGADWESAARLACKNCHKDAFSEYANGIHSPAGQPGEEASVTAASRVAQGKPANVPLCGDCHGGHAIPSMDDTAAMTAQHRSGLSMCGQCHEAEAATYTDYYHGAAYRRGSLDAPSCWDCHGFHEILAADDRRSPVHPSRLSETCGQTGCHTDIDDAFLEYALLIHGHDEIRDSNPVLSVVGRARETISRALQTVRSWF